MKETAGMGLSTRVVDNAFWLGNDTSADLWIDVLDDIDNAQDDAERNRQKQRLVDLLKSDHELSPLARYYLADLLERYNLKRPKGGRKVPAYDLSEIERRVALAISQVKNRDKKKVTLAEAQRRAADSYRITLRSLKSAYEKPRGSARRMKERHRP
jgi:hypothetical protein